MYSGQAMVHTSGAPRRRGPRAGDGRRDADRVVPSARRVRRHRAGGRRAPRGDGRDRGRRPAGRAARRDGRGDRGDPGPARARREGRPTTRPPSSPPAASSRCSTRSPSSAGWPASTRPGALAIYGPLIEQTLGNARALGIRAALTGPMTRGDRGHARRPPRGAARARARRPRPLRRRGRTRDRPRRGPWRADTGGCRRPRASSLATAV